MAPMDKNKRKFILLGGGLLAVFALAAILLKLLGGHADPAGDPGPLATRQPDTTTTAETPGTASDSVTGAPEDAVETGETAGSENTATGGEYQAPDFTLTNNRGETQALGLSRARHRSQLGPLCPPCRSEMPMLNAWYQEIAERDDIVFMAVDLTDGGRETRDAADRFISGEGYSFPYYYDERQAGMPSAAELYYVQSIPATWIIAPNFDLYYQHRGILTREQLDHYLAGVQSYAAGAD